MIRARATATGTGTGTGTMPLPCRSDRTHDGLGAAAVAAGERWSRAAGARKTQLMVRTTNDQVRGFHEHLGYTDQSTTVLGRWL